MERRVKERLVGAGILVALVVLVVPELLSGPKLASTPKPGIVEAVRNVTVDLATSKATATERVAAVAPPAETPLPTVAAPAVTAPAGTAPVVAAPAVTAPVVAAPIAVPILPTPSVLAESAHPPWALQLGSFASRANAGKLLSKLKSQRFPAYLITSGSGSGLRYRIRIGPLADRIAAERAVAKVKALGHPASIVPPEVQ